MTARSVVCSVSLAGQGFPIFSFDGLLPRVPAMSRSAALFVVWCLSLCGVRPHAHSTRGPLPLLPLAKTDRRTCNFQPWRSLGTLASGHLTCTTACIIFVFDAA